MNLTENITINTHSSIRIGGSKVLYFDPFQITEACGDADIIFITHDHFDHFDVKSVAAVKKAETKLAAPAAMRGKILAEAGIAEENCVFYQPGDKAEVDGLEIEAVAAYNKLKPFHMKSKGWLGYVVTLDGTRYYVAGDTDVTAENKQVKCDVALLPVGGTFTMDKKQGAELAIVLKPKAVIPTHYGEVAGSPEDGKQFQELLEQLAPEINVVLKM